MSVCENLYAQCFKKTVFFFWIFLKIKFMRVSLKISLGLREGLLLS